MSNTNEVTSSPNSGAGDDVSRYQGTQQLLQVLHQDSKKGSTQAPSKGPMANRPIAPAPGPVSGGHHTGSATTAQPAHNIVAKVPAALVSSGVEVAHANMSALQQAAAAVAASTAHQSLSLPTPVGIVSSGANLPHLRVPMASLIRGTTQFTAGQTHPVATASGTATIQQHAPSVVHAFQSHVPRGAVQASQLAASKTTPLATPAVRGIAPNTMQISTVASATNSAVQQLQHSLHSQPKALQLPVQTSGPTTAPVNRAGSPQVTLPTAEHRLPTAYHRPLVSPQPSSTVQITIQQPRVPGQMMSQQAKSVQSPGTVQKQIMSQAAVPPMIHPATTTAKIGATHSQSFPGQVIPRPQAKVIVTQATTTPIMQTTNMGAATPTTPKAFGITVTGALTKGQKIVMTQASSIPTIQNPLPVSLAPHPVMEPSMRVISGGSGGTLSLTAASLPRQKVTMATHAAVTNAIHGSIVTQPKSVVAAVTLAASSPSLTAVQGAGGLPSGTGTVTTVPSIPVAKVQPTRQLPQTAHVVSQPTQQVAIHQPASKPQTTPAQVSHEAPGQRDTPAVGAGSGVVASVAAGGVTAGSGGSGAPSSLAAVTTITQASIFLSAAHRGSPNTATTAITMPTTHSDGRTTDRSNLPAHLPYAPLPQEYYTASIVNYQNYPNLLYQNVQGHPQAFASIPAPAGTSIRPNIVPSQPQNLTATFPAHGTGAAGTGGSQGVRLSPMMVTVDPGRHVVHTQFTAAQTDGLSSESGSATASLSSGTLLTSSGALLTSSGPTQTTTSAPAPLTQPPVVNNPSASPRPSILRKRPNDGNVALVKKNLMTLGLEVAGSGGSSSTVDSAHPPAPAISPKSSICDPSRENSQSSTDTATSSESPPTSVQTPDLRKEFKQEPMDVTENGNAPGAPLGGLSLPNSIEASPRKKPRKQLLNANEELKDGTSSEEEVDQLSSTPPEVKKELEKAEAIKKEEEYIDSDGIRWVAERKRPNISLLNHYQCTWKARNNHFLKHSDVKPKEERRPTVNELANQKSIIQKASGWKLYHLAAQLEEMMDLERDMYKKMAEVQEAIAPKHIAKHTMEDDIGMVHELTQGNIQRSQLMIDQLEEAKTSMTKILDHKNRIMDIIVKHHSKRPVKKKERT